MIGSISQTGNLLIAAIEMYRLWMEQKGFT